MANLHIGLGIDLAKVTSAGIAQTIDHWSSNDGTRIPFGPLPPGLDGVEFHQLWLRALETGAPEAHAPLPLADETGRGWLVQSEPFADILAQLGRKVGLVTADDAVQCSMLLNTTAHELDIACDVAIDLGEAAIPIHQKQGLRLHVLHQTSMAIAEAFPDDNLATVELEECRRKIDVLQPGFEDMDYLLAGGETPSPSLLHRIAVWNAMGRLTPVDHDPFGPAEWMTALMAAGHTPERVLALTEKISGERIAAHIGSVGLA